jgi:tRNA pseudouridine38-40 synthase
VRIRLDVAYDGTAFHGWAAQPGLRTVEGELSAALATVLRVPEVALTCAGRTDAGVHARGQVVHADLDSLPDGDGSMERLARRLNGVLDADVRVLRAREAPAGFDARFSALWRRYAYRVADRPAAVDPLRRAHVLAWPRPVDEVAMNAAAPALVGEHDFAAFCKQREGATTIRTLVDLRWEREPDGLLVAHVRADAFCHSMVRSLVGCLLAVGEGRRPAEWAAEVLAAERRDSAVAVAPAHGLTLEEVGYPPDAELAARVEVTRARRG